MLPITWFLVGDASRALLLRGVAHHPMVVVKEFTHPESRQDVHDLKSDREGRSQHAGQSTFSVALSPKHNAKETEQANFAKELADFLASSSAKQDFERLFLVAPAHFLGILRGKLDTNVSKKVQATFSKDLTNLSLPELSTRLLELTTASA